MTIAESIEKLMREEGHTTRSFAELFNVCLATVHNWIRGKRTPQVKRLREIASVCNRILELKISKKYIDAKFLLRESPREITFDQKLKECYQPLFRFCRVHLCKSADDTKDLVQETLYAALKHHSTLYPDVSMLTWLIGIAKNISRKKASKLVYVESYIETDLITDEIETYFQNHGDVFRFIEKLTPKRREAYKLALIGLEYKEIAKKLNTTEGTIKTMMGQTKIRLRKMIENENKLLTP
jgi:RNA polymerase sigma factor (sigma-70 family)